MVHLTYIQLTKQWYIWLIYNWQNNGKCKSNTMKKGKDGKRIRKKNEVEYTATTTVTTTTMTNISITHKKKY